jgi:hypothetical protein
MNLYRRLLFTCVLFSVVLCSWSLASESKEADSSAVSKQTTQPSTEHLLTRIGELERRISQLEAQMLYVFKMKPDRNGILRDLHGRRTHAAG